MKILLITYYFPPTDYGATNRLMRLIPFLEKESVEFYVVTVLASRRVTDESLVVGMRSINKVVRTKQFLAPTKPKASHRSRDSKGIGDKHYIQVLVSGLCGKLKRLLKRSISIPDSNFGWYPYAKSAALKLAVEEPFDLIFSTAPSRTAHMVAYAVHNKTRIPWVADFRDSWFDYRNKDYLIKHLVNKWLLKRILVTSDQVIFTSRNLMNYYGNRFPHLENKLHFVPHGIERIESLGLTNHKVKDEFWLGYIGSMDRLRSPEDLLSVLDLLRINFPEEYRKVRVKLVGAYTGDYRVKIENHTAGEKIDFIGFVSRQESLDWMYSCDCLLILLSDVPWIGLGACASKIYDYFALRKAVLGLVPNGYIYSLIKEMKAGDSFSRSELRDAARWLSDYISKDRHPEYDQRCYAKLQVEEAANTFYNVLRLASRKGRQHG